MNFIQRLRLSAFCLGMLAIVGLIMFGLSKIPHIENAILVVFLIGLTYMTIVIITAIISFIVWLISGKNIFPKWMK